MNGALRVAAFGVHAALHAGADAIVRSEAGDVVLFDSYRLHQIQPFSGAWDRISGDPPGGRRPNAGSGRAGSSGRSRQGKPGTGVGRKASTVPPLPSWPSVLIPQQSTVPSTIAHADKKSTASALTTPSMPETGVANG
jgi:hypothetical protein